MRKQRQSKEIKVHVYAYSSKFGRVCDIASVSHRLGISVKASVVKRTNSILDKSDSGGVLSRVDVSSTDGALKISSNKHIHQRKIDDVQSGTVESGPNIVPLIVQTDEQVDVAEDEVVMQDDAFMIDEYDEAMSNQMGGDKEVVGRYSYIDIFSPDNIQ